MLGLMRLLCIRHAESTMNAAGVWQGQADPPLSRVGRGQARALARRLAESGEARGLAALATSDLRRARQTAEILGERLELCPLPLPALRERDVGAWSGRSHAQIAARWPGDLRRFRAGEELRPGGGESRAEFQARLRGALAELAALAARRGGRPVAVVTHLGVLRALRPAASPGNAQTLWLDLPQRCA